MKRSRRTILHSAVVIFLGRGFSTPLLAQKKKQSTTEVFHVSRVGRTNFAETREQLIDFYREVEADFNREAEQSFREKEQAFEGARVRVLEVMDEQEEGRPLYLVAYDGGPSVFFIAGSESWKPGDLTPPLEVQPNGEFRTEVTRVVVEKEENDRHPGLEEAEEGLRTFFGIPIDGGSSAPAASSGKGKKKGSDKPKTKRKRVTEVKTLPRFRATPSKKELTAPPKFTTDLFVSAVKNGEIYELVREEKRRCQNCGGFKRVQSTLPLGERDPDGKMPCPECSGEGTIVWDVTYRVTW